MSQDILAKLGDSFEGKDAGNGGWFKAADHSGAYAIIVETLEHLPNQPGYSPGDKPRDIAIADVTVLGSEEEAGAGIVKAFLPSVNITGNLGKSLARKIGSIEVYRLGKQDSGKGNPAWVWKSPTPDCREVVKNFLLKRAAAVADAPDEW